MAFFDYEATYTDNQLYDWVLTELAVAKQLGLSSLATFLNNFQVMLNEKNIKEGKPMFIPTLPKEEDIKKKLRQGWLVSAGRSYTPLNKQKKQRAHRTWPTQANRASSRNA